MSDIDIKLQERDERTKEAERALGVSFDEPKDENENEDEESKAPEVENQDEDEDESTEEEDESEDSDDDDEEDEDDDPEDRKSTKKTVPLSRFKQEKRLRKELQAKIGNLETEVEKLSKGKNQKDVEASVENLDEIVDGILEDLKDIEVDEGQKEFLKKFSKAILLKSKALAPAAIPEELKEKIKLLDKLQSKDNEETADNSFKNEWNEFLPELDKKYPNATPAMKQEAYALMKKIATSKDGGRIIKQGDEEVLVGYPLDYILSKNQKKFDILLKTLKNDKSFEEGNKNLEEDSDDEDVNYLDSNMSPEKLQKIQEAKTRKRMKEAQKTGKIRFV